MSAVGSLFDYQRTNLALQLKNMKLEEENEQLQEEIKKLRSENQELKALIRRYGPELIERITRNLLLETKNNDELMRAIVYPLPKEQQALFENAFQEVEQVKTPVKRVVISEGDIDFTVISEEKNRLEQLFKDLEKIYEYMEKKDEYNQFMEELKKEFPHERSIIEIIKNKASKTYEVVSAIVKALYRKCYILSQVIGVESTLGPYVLIAISMIAHSQMIKW